MKTSLILGLLLSAVTAPALAQLTMCPPQSIVTQTRDGMIKGYYESGFLYSTSENCYTPWEKVEIEINVLPMDVGRGGLMYVGAFNQFSQGALLTTDGMWEIYQGGLHNPTASFTRTPRTIRFTVIDTKPEESIYQNGWAPRREPVGPMTVCDIMASFGESWSELGGGYGVIQDEQQDKIDSINANPHVSFDMSHLEGAFAYNDGIHGRKYGPVLTFNCQCGNLPLEIVGATCTPDSNR